MYALENRFKAFLRFARELKMRIGVRKGERVESEKKDPYELLWAILHPTDTTTFPLPLR